MPPFSRGPRIRPRVVPSGSSRPDSAWPDSVWPMPASSHQGSLQDGCSIGQPVGGQVVGLAAPSPGCRAARSCRPGRRPRRRPVRPAARCRSWTGGCRPVGQRPGRTAELGAEALLVTGPGGRRPPASRRWPRRPGYRRIWPPAAPPAPPSRHDQAEQGLGEREVQARAGGCVSRMCHNKRFLTRFGGRVRRSAFHHRPGPAGSPAETSPEFEMRLNHPRTDYLPSTLVHPWSPDAGCRRLLAVPAGRHSGRRTATFTGTIRTGTGSVVSGSSAGSGSGSIRSRAARRPSTSRPGARARRTPPGRRPRAACPAGPSGSRRPSRTGRPAAPGR